MSSDTNINEMIDDLVERARKASLEFSKLNQEQVDVS